MGVDIKSYEKFKMKNVQHDCFAVSFKHQHWPTQLNNGHTINGQELDHIPSKAVVDTKYEVRISNNKLTSLKIKSKSVFRCRTTKAVSLSFYCRAKRKRTKFFRVSFGL